MKILFTPLGKTDPMSISAHDDMKDIYDASMMHICRFYDFDKVIMYMSKEICEFDELDNRYEIALNYLKNLTGKKFEIEKVRNQEDTDPHLFDKYYDEFEEIIKKQTEKYGEDTEIYVNISSGTPGMKTALQIISALSKYRIKALQVAGPNGGRGQRNDDLHNYDVDGYWESNLDNEIATPERVTVSEVPNLLFRIQKESLISLIDNYEYNAAYDFVKNHAVRLDPSIPALAEFAKARYALDDNNYMKIQKDNNWDFIPYKKDDMRNLFEFALLMNIKAEKKELLDFCRCVTPFLFQSTTMIVKKKYNIDIYKYVNRSEYINRDEIVGLERGKEILGYLDAETARKYRIKRNITHDVKNPPKYRDTRLSQFHTIAIINGLEKTKKGNKLLEAINNLDEFREMFRNQAAHEIVCITQDYIERKTNKHLSDYIGYIKTILKYLGYDVGNNWDSYNKMNAFIKERIKEI